MAYMEGMTPKIYSECFEWFNQYDLMDCSQDHLHNTPQTWLFYTKSTITEFNIFSIEVKKIMATSHHPEFFQ